MYNRSWKWWHIDLHRINWVAWVGCRTLCGEEVTPQKKLVHMMPSIALPVTATIAIRMCH